MAVSGIASQINNQMRLTGMVSGLDTDTLVKKLMATDQAKLDKLKQNRDLDLWKTDAYRDITSTLQSFYNQYFDTLSSTNLKSANSFSFYSSSYAATTSTDYVTVTPTASANAGTYSITSLTAAQKATLSAGTSVNKPVEGVEILDSSVSSISSANDNNTFVFTLNGKTMQFTLNDSGTDTKVTDLQAELQSKIDNAFGANNITVGFTSNATNDGGKLSFTAVRNTDSFSIGTAYNSGSTALFSAAPSFTSPFVVTSSNNKFELTIGGVTHTVAVDAGTLPQTYADAASLANAMKTAADAAFGGTADITFGVTDGKVTYTSGQTVSIAATPQGTNGALGLSGSNLNNKVDLNAKIYDIAGQLNTNPNVTGIGNDIQFSINGIFFNFNSKTSSINDIMKAVNSNTSINATMSYDITTNSFKVQSKDTGATTSITATDTTGNFLLSLGVSGTDKGSDASVTVNGLTINRPTNVFTYDGLTYNIKNDFKAGTDPVTGVVTDPIKLTVSSDTSKAYDFIKGFVDKYNEVIDKLNTKVSEKRDKDYMPLTDEQKSAMTSDQIDKWDAKAKAGLLNGDSTISDILSKLRTSLYDSVQNVGIDLTSIGITTSSDYTQKGKLVIDETKLKDALASKPQDIIDLFTKTSDVTYYDAVNSPTLRTQRYNESGIAQRFSDVIQDAIRTSTDSSGNKGTLLEKAGIVGDRSEYSNVLFKEIMDFDSQVTEMNQKLSDKETALYNKFAAMESALSKMNSQSSWITQQFGG